MGIELLRHVKDLTVKSFSLSVMINGRMCKIEARKNISSDFRFKGKLERNDETHAFVIIRSSTGKWIISGEKLPVEVQDNAQEIGKAMVKNSI